LRDEDLERTFRELIICVAFHQQQQSPQKLVQLIVKVVVRGAMALAVCRVLLV
jgi:hypothetical protein